MNQRRKLTNEEREAAAIAARTAKPGKGIFVQEFTDIDGRPIVVTIIEQ